MYIDSFAPQSKFEYGETMLLSDVTGKPEVAVLATRALPEKYELPHLAGRVMEICENEEKELQRSGRDTSLIRGKNGKTSIFLGPARFVNHDCRPNVKVHKMKIIACSQFLITI